MKKKLVLAVFALTACAPLLKAGGFPPEALRRDPPKGIAGRAAAVGTPAPLLPTTDDFRVPAALARGPLVVVFFRGTW